MPAALLAFDRGGYWIDFVLPVLATSLMGLGSDALDRRRFRDSFARYLSRDVMAEVLADAPSLRGEYRTVSILFSDLRGFTTLSEQMEPDADRRPSQRVLRRDDRGDLCPPRYDQ